MDMSTKRAWVALHRTPNLTNKVLNRLIRATNTPEEILSLSSQQLTELNVSDDIKRSLTYNKTTKNRDVCQKLDQDCKLLDQLQITVLPLNNPLYPELLKQISDPPSLLYIRGDVSLLELPQLAMVGSRKPSRQGRENAFQLSKELVDTGFTITSGLALGIDTHSHLGALESTHANTIAVVGTGIDRIYPAANKELHHQIVQRGAVVSEFPLGSDPNRYHFPQRNRIISGLSLGVLVVEAANKSGSLISAKYALEQNREVFAMPGSIHNPMSKGCHTLIRQGAKLVESSNDIIEEFNGWFASKECSNADSIDQVTAVSDSLDSEEEDLLSMLGYDPATIDVLLYRSGWPVSVLSARLSTLEMKGMIESHSGTYQRIKKTVFI